MGPQELASMAWTQAWQLTALIVAVLLAVGLWGRKRPHLVHALWIVVLLKAVTPPVISSPCGVFSQVPIFAHGSAWLVQPNNHEEASLEDEAAGNDSGDQVVAAETESGMQEWRGAGQLFRVPGSPFEDDPQDLRAGMLPSNEMSAADDVRSITEPSRPERSTLYGSAWISYAAGIWIAGATLLALVAAVRWLGCLRHLCRHDRIRDAGTESLLADLSQRLKVRRRVRLWITEGRIGPAVVGIFRPTILLPALIVRGRSPQMLAAILAHELLHIRRGDLWAGWLQLVAQGVWWFHPLVWLAGRRATRAAEACCDAETIAELGCAPADYAASLLDVLELKTRLVSIPAVPGLKPVDVTRERLERIMQLRQGSLARSPWRNRLTLLLAAGLALPGAAWMAGAAEPEGQPAKAQDAAVEPTNKLDVNTASQTELTEKEATSAVDVPPPWERVIAGWKYQVALSRHPHHPHDGWLPPYLRIRRAEPEQNEAQILRYEGKEIIHGPVEEGPHPSNYLIRLRGDVSVKMDDFLATADSGVIRIPLAETFPTTPGGPVRMSLELQNARWKGGELGGNAAKLEASFGTRGTREAWKLALYQLTILGRDGAQDVAPSWDGRALLAGGDFALRADHVALRYFNPIWWPPLKADSVTGRPQVVMAKGHVHLARRQEGKTIELLTADRLSFDVRRDGLNSIRQGVDPHLNAAAREFTELKEERLGAPFTISGTGVNSNAGLVGTIALVQSDEDGQNAAKKKYRREPNPNRVKIEKALLRPISVSFKDAPLSEVVKNLTEQLEVNVVLSPDGLEDVGLNSKAPVSIQLDGVTTRGVLRLILEPLQLAYVVEDEILKITSRQRSRGELSTTTYPVADLVVLATSAPGDPKTQADFKSLIALITSSIEPDTWDDVGGPGSVRPFNTTLSLVIRQTEDVHDQIAELLGQLRRLQDLQAAIEISLVRLPQDVTPQSIGLETDPRDSDNGIRLTEDQARAMREAVRANSTVKSQFSPKPTLFNGQGAHLTLPLPSKDAASEEQTSLHLAAIIGADHRNLRMTLAVGAKTPEEAIARSMTIVSLDRQTSVIDITDNLHPLPFPGITTDRARDIGRRFDLKPSERILMIVTPQIIKPEVKEDVQ